MSGREYEVDIVQQLRASVVEVESKISVLLSYTEYCCSSSCMQVLNHPCWDIVLQVFLEAFIVLLDGLIDGPYM